MPERGLGCGPAPAPRPQYSVSRFVPPLVPGSWLDLREALGETGVGGGNGKKTRSDLKQGSEKLWLELWLYQRSPWPKSRRRQWEQSLSPVGELHRLEELFWYL